MRLNKIALALGLTSMVGLIGCEDSSSTPPVNAPTQSFYQVKAIDGYLQHAKVWLDLNGNFEQDANEPSTTSGAGGVAELDVTQVVEQGLSPESYQVIVQAIAGETIDEDKPDTPLSSGFTMSAPAGEVNVTPLSTLVNIKLSESITDDMSAEKIAEMKKQAVSELASELGIDETAVLSDYVAKKDSDEQATSDAAQQAAYAARSIVESEQVLPETPQEMNEVVEEVKESDSETDFEKLAAVVNNEIKKEVEDTPDPQMLEDAQPAIDKNADMTIDSDQDGVPDELDPFPQDSSEWMDNDEDGIGDHSDTDDDDDGFTDDVDVFPLDAKKAGDHDGDGTDSVNDQYPYDFDNDSYPDAEDDFPKDPAEWLDSDGDEVGDNADVFPDDPTEWADSDGDEVGDNEDAFRMTLMNLKIVTATRSVTIRTDSHLTLMKRTIRTMMAMATTGMPSQQMLTNLLRMYSPLKKQPNRLCSSCVKNQ
ncbi:microbial collagenase [Vibrio ishigakensis]|uniref:Microbial collagenase n=1 Tax=Vibrio ishigakensis TaxID=1481914 RepID=A0A0B8Q599_9VIBR|nr:microbial collagenase [Vibrio ishigakensis]